MAAKTPEDVDRLFEERVNAGDVDGVLALYEPGATLVMPEGDLTGFRSVS
jgi:ketosteroid isomerase-like protein